MHKIELYGDIGDSFWGGVSAADLSAQLRDDDIELRINSPGGDVFEGVAMYNLLKTHPYSVSVHVDGWAASAASIVAMAGDTIEIGGSAFLMIHNPWTVAIGESAEMRKTADLLDKVKGEIVEAYATRVDDRAQIAAWMDDETWFTGAEAVEAGLADTASTADPATQNKSKAAYAGTRHKVEAAIWQHERNRRQLELAKRKG